MVLINEALACAYTIRFFIHIRLNYFTLGHAFDRNHWRRLLERHLNCLVRFDALLCVLWVGSQGTFAGVRVAPWIEMIAALLLAGAIGWTAARTVRVAQRLGKPRGTELVARLPLVLALRRDAAYARKVVPLSLAGRAFEHRTPLREVSAFVVCSCLALWSTFLVTASASISTEFQSGSSHHPPPVIRFLPPAPRAGHPAGGKSPAAGSESTNSQSSDESSGQQTSNLEKQWTDVCVRLPGADAPPWASPLLYALYLGGDPQLHLGPAPGAYAGGCTQATFVPERGDGTFAYVLGYDPQNSQHVLSLGVVSRQLGPAIYYAPAERPVLGLIHKGEIVGGPPRGQVGDGDYYLIRTTTVDVEYALVRSRTTLPDGHAARYVELSPGAFRAWRDAMKAHDEWLWPVARRRVDGHDVFSLVTNPMAPDRTLVETIVCDPATGASYRDVDGRLIATTWGDIDFSEIAALARLGGLAPVPRSVPGPQAPS